MNSKYAQRMQEAKPSIIRESLKLAADPSIISLAGGNPDALLFPKDELLDSCAKVIGEDGRVSLQYSVTEGNEELRRLLIKKMDALGIECGLENIAITSGSQQGLDLTAKIFVDKDDEVIIESPSYMGAINAFKYYLPKFIEVDMDSEGMRMDMLEETLKTHPKAKYIYTIPDFQNPTGRTMSRERRKQLAALAEKYDIYVVEDSPYYDLRFAGESIPPIKHYDKTGKVIYLGSMSKILCPALRVGWIIADPEIINSYVVLKQAADLHSNEVGQRQIAEYLKANDLNRHISEINGHYKKKLDMMLKMLDEDFPAGIEFTRPEGGLFVWLTLPKGYDSAELFKIALCEEKVAFIPGDTFYPYGGHPETIRLSFATVSLEDIEEGMKRLARVLHCFIK